MNYLGKIVHCYSPTFAAFAPLRESIPPIENFISPYVGTRSRSSDQRGGRVAP
jgi:hypothetical protein